MSYEYGYGKLEDELISLFRSGAPDVDRYPVAPMDFFCESIW